MVIGLIRNSCLLCRRNLMFRSHRKFSFESYVETIQSGWVWISEAKLTCFMERVLVFIHDSGHLPWWGTLFVGAVGLRLSCFPIYWFQEKLRAKRFQMEGKITQAMNKRRPAVMTSKMQAAFAIRTVNIVGKEAQRVGLQLSRVMVLAFVPIPFWICMCVGLRKLSGSGFVKDADGTFRQCTTARPEMSTEGLLWTKNFLKTDTWYVWPASTFVTLLLNSRANRVDHSRRALLYRFLYRWRQAQFTLLAVFCFYIASVLPACMGYFWFLGSACSLVQFLLFQHPVIKKFLSIKPYPWDTRQPFRALFRKPWTPPKLK